jgi:hypothetical protein
VSEKTWNWFTTGEGSAASSGGISTTYTIPTWQQGVNMTTNQGSTSLRNIPDVALTGDNVIVYYGAGSQAIFGGTSVAAPLWAGYAALANQRAGALGKPVIGFINPAVYAIGKGSNNYAILFHDITTGNNTNPSTSTKFFSKPGYDLCTGWGTPAGVGLIAVLAGAAPPVFGHNPFTEPSAFPGHAYSANMATNASDPNAATLSFSKSSGPVWLNVATNGALSGTPGGANGGTNSFTILATDTFGATNSATMLILVVSNLPPTFTANPFSEPGLNVGQTATGTLATNATDPNIGDTLTFAKVSGPTWLIISTNGALSGSPTNSNAGTNTFVVSVTDSGGLSNVATMTIKVTGAPSFVVTPFSEVRANAGQAYSATVATNSVDPNPGLTPVFSKASGPAWLTVATSGALSGTPANSDSGTNTFLLRITDSGGLTNFGTMTIYVNGAPSFTSNPINKPAGNVGHAYSGTIATNATDPNPGDVLTFAKVSGPGWLAIATNGALSGTPGNTDFGTNSFVVSATDPGNLSANATMNIVIAAPINLSISPQRTNVLLSWTGGNAPFQAQMMTNPASPIWGNVGGPLNTNRLTLTPSNRASYFRVQGQ